MTTTMTTTTMAMSNEGGKDSDGSNDSNDSNGGPTTTTLTSLPQLAPNHTHLPTCTSATSPQRGGKKDAAVSNATTTSNGPPRYVNPARTWGSQRQRTTRQRGPTEGESNSAASRTQQWPFEINPGK